MTVKEYVDTIKNTLDREDSTSQFHPNLIRLHCDFTWNQILHDAFRKDLSYLDFYAKEYNSITPTLNSTTNRYEALFPAPIVQLPNRSEGVRNLSTNQGTGLEFVPISEQEWRYTDGMEVDTVETTTKTYFVRTDRAIFANNFVAADAAAGVSMRLVIPFSEFDDDDELPVPSGQGENFINMVLARLRSIPPVDLSNKNN